MPKKHSYYHQVQLHYMFHPTILSGVIFVCIPHVVLPLKGIIWIPSGKLVIALNSMITT